MSIHTRVLIFGASARACAFSALRAGLLPWCVDLFADADLVAHCPAMRLTGEYPEGFADIERDAPDGPWMYTGGIENYPRLVTTLAARRQLWGNDGEILYRCRAPAFLHDAALRAGLPAPELPSPKRAWATPAHMRSQTRYLLKPLNGAGGRGITFWSATSEIHWGRQYLQEYIEGLPCSAVYVGGNDRCEFLGATRQLVGETWLNAKPFQYCGNVGPMALTPTLEASLRRLGCEIGAAGVCGLFGVDGILRDGEFWPVELNPRYTASVEVIEYATGVRALDLHRAAVPDGKPQAVAKAILFAPEAVTFPAEGPWTPTLQNPRPVEEMPDFADLPHAGDHIQQGWPVCTLFSHGDPDKCLLELHRLVELTSTALGWSATRR